MIGSFSEKKVDKQKNLYYYKKERLGTDFFFVGVR